MGGQQQLVRTAKGLYSQFNPINAVPEGALLQAENCVIDREGILSSRRGWEAFSAPGVPSDLFEYKGRILMRVGDSMYYAADQYMSAWNLWGTGFTPPSGWNSAWVEANGNFYVTTSTGIKKNDSLTGTPVNAGIQKGLDIQYALNASSGWLAGSDTTAASCAYRIAWSRDDANANYLIGRPSERIIVNNDAAAARSVDLTFTVPDEIKSGDYFEVYRTQAWETANESEVTRYYRIVRQQISAAQLTAKSVSFSDTYDEAGYLKTEADVSLYTNDTVEGSTNPNDRPPYATVVESYEGHVFYGNIRRQHQISLRLLTVTGLSDDVSKIIINTGATTLTYTFSTANGTQTFERVTSGTEAANVRDTMLNFCYVVNNDTSNNSVIYADYISGATDQPGKVLIRRRDFADSPIYLTADTDEDTAPYTGTKFEPALPDSGSTVASTNEAHQNYIAISKYQRPEAVPFLNTLEVGSSDKAILAMKALKDAMIIAKEDGLYILTGKTDGATGVNFSVEILDPTIILREKRTAVLLDNSLHSFTTQGVVRAVGGGSSIVSRPIEPDLNKLATFSRFNSTTFAVSYESDRKYLLFTAEDSDDTTAAIVWVYNYITGAWTTWRGAFSCGIVLKSDDKLYLGDASSSQIFQERKSYSSSYDDDQDESYDATITAVSTTTDQNGATVTTITLDYTGSEALTAGWYAEQGVVGSHVTAYVDNGSNSYTLTLDTQTGFITGACKLYKPIFMKVKYTPLDGGNVSTVKHFAICQFTMEQNDAYAHDIGFHADTQPNEAMVDQIRFSRESTEVTQFGWGQFEWGNEPWGEEQVNPFTYTSVSTPVRTMIPRSHQRCRALKVIYRHRMAREKVNIVQMAVDVRTMGPRTSRRGYG